MGGRVSRRILITGSRYYTDTAEMAMWIGTLNDDDIVIHGGARGADHLAEKAARARGLEVETWPAPWDEYGKAAGYIRNQDMVNAGADLCYAFPLELSKGTWDCVKRARKAGIPVIVIGEDQPHEQQLPFG